jgi:hypothetical protein
LVWNGYFGLAEARAPSRYDDCSREWQFLGYRVEAVQLGEHLGQPFWRACCSVQRRRSACQDRRVQPAQPDASGDVVAEHFLGPQLGSLQALASACS